VRWLVTHPGPEFSVADVHAGWCEALTALGQDVVSYNLNDRLLFYDALTMPDGTDDGDGHPMIRKALSHEQAITLATKGLLEACYTWWPDVVLVVSAFFVPAKYLEMMRGRGHKVVLLHTESPYQDDEQLRRGQFASVNLLNDPTNLEMFKMAGPAAYMPHAYREGFHCPGPPVPEMVCDLTFNGTAFDSRIAFFEAMDLSGLDVMLTGNWEYLPDTSPLIKYLAHEKDRCLDNEQTVETYRSARCGINFYRREFGPTNITMIDGPAPLKLATGDGWAVGPREIEMAACGLFFLRDPRGESDELFPMLPTFDGPGDAAEKLRWWLDDPPERWRAAQAAREAIAPRTFTANARTLLRLLDGLPVTITK
jgi:spore maturation protein CgeB